MNAVLQAFQVAIEFYGAFGGERVNDPVLLAFGVNHALLAEIGEVFRNFYLWLTKNALKMADAQRRLCEQVKNAKAGAVAKALIDFDQLHALK